MKKYFLMGLLTFVGFVGLSGIARAGVKDEIVMTLPFEFVAGGQTLPAGTYTVSGFSDDKLEGLILSNSDYQVRVIVLPTTFGSADNHKPAVSFERVGGTRFLSKIESAGGVYTFRVSRAAVLEASSQSTGVDASTSSGK